MRFSVSALSQTRGMRIAGQSKLIFVALALGLASWGAGLSIASSFKIVALSAFVALPGVRSLNWHNRASQELSASEQWILGVPLGYVICLGSQQVFLAIGLGYWGWVVPIAVSLLGVRRSQFLRSGTHAQATHLVMFAAASCLILADVNWAFMLPPLALCLGLVFGRRFAVPCFLGGLLTVRFAGDRYWYLVSDDRLFEEAYSRAIHNFGFWDWYGSSDTWVPYHWFGHAFGGLFQWLRIGTDFQSVGIAPQVIGAFILCSSLWVILRRLGLGETEAFIGTFLAPLLGRFALGVSNSADMSIALSFWAIAITVCIASRPTPVVSSTLLIGIAVSAVVLTKFSTGLILAVGIVVLVFGLRRSQGEAIGSLVQSGVVASVALAVAVLNFGLTRSSELGDSRSNVEFLLGGYLRPLIGGAVSAGVVVAVAFVAALSIPLLLIRDQHVHGSRANVVLYSASSMMVVGLAIRFLTLSYNNDSYLEAALLCAAPLLAGVVYPYIRHKFDWRLQTIFVLTGAGVGLAQRMFEFWSNSSNVVRRLQVFGDLPLIEVGASVLVGLAAWQLIKSKSFFPPIPSRRMVVICLLIGGFIGGDAFRIALQVKTQTVWASTNFGASDQFFFGSNDEQDAAQWIRKNSQLADMIATNRICPLGEGCSLDGQSPISAWTHRRSFVEAERFITGRSVDETSYGELTPRGHPMWLTDRRRLMLDFALDQNESSRQKLIAAGVRWFWLDVSLPSATLVDESLVVYRNKSIAILEL